MINNFKKIAIGIIMSSVMLTNSVNASAYVSLTRTIDNDSIATGYGNNDVRSAYTYMKSSSLYNGDARYISSSNSNCEYYWSYPGLTSNTPEYFNITVGAYLNHSLFTDTAAKYYVNYYPHTYSPVGSINQNTAPGGWNYITVKNVRSLNINSSSQFAGYYSYDAYITPSGLSNKYTGADGLQVRFSY